MKVSVLIPSYNHAKYVDTAIQSVLNQSFSDIEILISDDCSEDNTKEILRRYENMTQISVFYQPIHIGAVEQIHFLVERASGEYIALLNSDDYWEMSKIQKQVDYLDSHTSVDACFTQAVMVDERGERIAKEQFELSDIFIKPNRTRIEWMKYFINEGNCLCHPSILARRGIYQGEYRLNQGLRQLPDYDLWTRYILKHELHVLQEPLTVHRRVGIENASACTKDNTKLLLREQAWIRKNMIENMSETDFVALFHKEIRKKNCCGIEVSCERFFVLARAGETNTAMLRFAIEFYLKQAYDAEFVQTMIKHYSFSDKDFFQLARKIDEQDKMRSVEKIHRLFYNMAKQMRED